MSNKFELIVIGSGPGGRRAAIQAAKLGKRALVIEKGHRVGGVSVHTGTIPSKTLRETVLNLSGWREREFYGRSYRVKQDITAQDLLQRLKLTLNHEVETLEHQFARNQVTTVRGCAHFLDPHTIEVVGDFEESNLYHGDYIVLATGTKPHRPDSVPFDGRKIVDCDDILNLQDIPRSLAVIGGGVIGVEYATIFSALDISVSLIESRADILQFVDQELIDDFIHQMRNRGMTLRLGEAVEKIEIGKSGKCVIHLSSRRTVQSDMVLYAAGRSGATDVLQLDKCGLSADARGKLSVNEFFQTEVPHIYAVGDVIGFPSLASTSMEQGRLAACHALGQDTRGAAEFFPYGIYSVPEISTVGMSEEEVRQRKIPYECGIARIRETSRGQIMGLRAGMLKAIFSLKSRRLLGVHIVGEGATELIHIGQAVLALKGTLDYFIDNAFNYPTLAEAYKIAALDAWNRIGK